MKSTLLTFFTIFSIIVFNREKYDSEIDNIVVLELFTSQGCSSCPPADRLLDEVKNDKIIALSYHVDYWNYIGWDDPFSAKKYTERQKLYSNKFNSSTIYTPQLVINGQEHIVGSNKSLLYTKLRYYSKKKNLNTVRLSKITKTAEKVKLNYAVTGNVTQKKIRFILVINERKTSIKRGENINRELLNTNIVINSIENELKDLSGIVTIDIPDVVESSDELTVIALVENDTLDIFGASQIKL
ncbi:MAG: DUF1223 domain-containing protein [Winogradskyella sp.]|uniref:DUF1223 domain-containing protein n=1 Tax=Winogradskyella sp. TaxID=1883156 RepID=UPI0025CF1E11|nr:DUF1223 domain-containing protein [Winogradskyella sp.]NRB59037.1 DUF1223 domain-containing protein [Winogradskyella sp.]